MRTVTTTVYKFSELSDNAKENARERVRQWDDLFAWGNECVHSIAAFCDHFGVTLQDWSVGPWSPINYKTNAENSHFRGVKLASINRETMPTGYCLDCALWQTMFDEFKRTGDAKHAFDQALDKAFREWRSDWEHAYSDEAIDETIEANEYEFTEDGNMV